MVSLALNIAAFLFLAIVGIIAFCLGIGIIIAFFRGIGVVAGAIVTGLEKKWLAFSKLKKGLVFACVLAIPVVGTIAYQKSIGHDTAIAREK